MLMTLTLIVLASCAFALTWDRQAREFELRSEAYQRWGDLVGEGLLTTLKLGALVGGVVLLAYLLIGLMFRA